MSRKLQNTCVSCESLFRNKKNPDKITFSFSEKFIIMWLCAEAVSGCFRISVRPARTLFLKVKVLSAPVSGKHIANMARVSTVRWNLKEACGKPLVRRTEIMYKAYSSDKTAE